MAAAAVAFAVDRPRGLGKGSALAIGAVVAGKGMERKPDRDVVWEPVVARDALYRRDTLRTGKNRTAGVRLADGSELRLGPETLVFLEIEGDETRIVFDHGSVTLARGEGGGKSRALSLESPEGAVKVDSSSRLTVSARGGEALSVVVESGRAVFTNGSGRPTEISAGSRARVSGGGMKVDVSRSPVSLKSPVNDALHVLPAASAATEFAVDGASSGKLSIEYRRADGDGAWTAANMGMNRAFGIPLPAGVWVWRARPEGGEPSEERRLTLIADPGCRLLSPAGNAAVTFLFKAPQISFAWTENPQAVEYELVVASDGEFKDLALRQRTFDTRLGLRKLGEGEWFWKLRWRLTGDGPEAWGESAPSRFSVERQTGVAAPRFIEPAAGAVFTLGRARQEGIFFSWESRAELMRYEIQFAAATGGILQSARVDRNYFLNRDLPVGDYRARLLMEVLGEDGATVSVTNEWMVFRVQPDMASASGSNTAGAIAPSVPGNGSPAPDATPAASPSPAPNPAPRPVPPAAATSANNPPAVRVVSPQPAPAVAAPAPPQGVVLTWSPATARGKVDGVDAESGILLKPGPHRIQLESDGWHPLSTNLVVAPGESGASRLALKKKRLQGEAIMLLDGTRLTGRIVEQDKDKVVLENRAGRKTIPRYEIESIELIKDLEP